MKKDLFINYFQTIQSTTRGQNYSKITRYFFPEFITAIALYSIPLLIDARFIAHLKSTTTYATLGVTNTLLHFIIKIAEGFSVGTIILAGQQNGIKNFRQTGNVLINAFWTTVIFGLLISAFLFFGASYIYYWYNVPAEMITMGVPFLKLRAISVFFTFIYFACIGFLRGIKNTRVPMYIFIAGSALFLLSDYLLIFGKWGFPELGLQGSAVASIVQYSTMCFIACVYLFLSKEIKPYTVSLLTYCAQWKNVKRLLAISWPIMVDKGTLAGAYLWLGKCLAPMGTSVLASFAVIKDLERFALLPAIAFAQVVTFLVSNACGKQDWDGIKITIKRIVLLSSLMVLSILFLCSLCPAKIIQFFDKQGDFTTFAAAAFPIISVFALFDVLQIILAGGLRGSANVKTVMITRLTICLGFFIPVSYFLSSLDMTNQMLKFVLIYSSLYLGNALMSILYIRRFKGKDWKKQAVRNSE